jgi:hypothetical protein
MVKNVAFFVPVTRPNVASFSRSSRAYFLSIANSFVENFIAYMATICGAGCIRFPGSGFDRASRLSVQTGFVLSI